MCSLAEGRHAHPRLIIGEALRTEVFGDTVSIISRSKGFNVGVIEALNIDSTFLLALYQSGYVYFMIPFVTALAPRYEQLAAPTLVTYWLGKMFVRPRKRRS